MSLIIAIGSNLGDRFENLSSARKLLEQHFRPIAYSKVYQSDAVGYVDQPDFLNQVLEFSLPNMTPQQCLLTVLELERQMGRVRDIKWGPRIIDIDIVFWELDKIKLDNLTIPHPHWIERSFVVRPLSELPFYRQIEQKYSIPDKFEVEAKPMK